MNRLRRFKRDYAYRKELSCTRIAQETAVVTCISSGLFLKMKVNQILTQSQAIVRKVEITIPSYHKRAMWKQFVHDFQLLVHIEPKVMKEMYRCLSGDSSASNDLNEAIVDERIQRIIQLQDPDILPDLRHLNKKRPEKYQIFWEACKKFIEECSAVDERHNGETTHLACAMPCLFDI